MMNSRNTMDDKRLNLAMCAWLRTTAYRRHSRGTLYAVFSFGLSFESHLLFVLGITTFRRKDAVVRKFSSLADTAVLEGEDTSETVTFEEPPAESSWICRFTSGPMGPCNTRANRDVPANRFCLPHYCCSKTVTYEDQIGMWCAKDPIFCNGLVYYPEFSFDTCSCWKGRNECHKAAKCIEQLEPFRGVFCRCKAGYVGDGKSCVKDPCVDRNPCGSHGVCKSKPAGGYSCECEQDYHEAAISGFVRCEKRNVCQRLENPCGPPERVKECKPNGDYYACICMPGWSAPSGLNKQCEKVTASPCENDPCGPPDAAIECIVKENASYVCSCRSGYAVEVSDGKETCVSMRGNPCDGNPCGTPSLVAECIPTSTAYTCTCREGAVVRGTDVAPYCADDYTAWYVIGGILCAFLLIYTLCQSQAWCLRRTRRSDEENLYESNYEYFDPSMM